MAGALGIYGLIVAVILQGSISEAGRRRTAPSRPSSHVSGSPTHAGLAAVYLIGGGMAIGVVGDVACARSASRKLFVGMILILIFAEPWDCTPSSRSSCNSRPAVPPRRASPCYHSIPSPRLVCQSLAVDGDTLALRRDGGDGRSPS